MAWRQLAAAGYLVADNPANSFLYLVTSIHALHVAGGLLALGATTTRIWRGLVGPAPHESIQRCATYWNFLLVVWLVLIALLMDGRGLRDPLQASADLERGESPWPAPHTTHTSSEPADRRLAFDHDGLGVGSAGVQERLLGKGHDVDFPPQRHLHLQLLAALVHDGAECRTTDPWPNPSEVFALTIGGAKIPLILIAIMTFVLISSSGTMAMAVNYGYRRDRVMTTVLMLATAAFGATFVGMQAFEWTKLIIEGVRPWGNPWGAPQFGSSFFMITGFHGTHVTIGVIFLLIAARKVWRGDFESERRGFFTSRKGGYEVVEITGLYWHFVDLVWVFIFALFYLW